jgi:hypothetical protein
MPQHAPAPWINLAKPDGLEARPSGCKRKTADPAAKVDVRQH